MVAADIPHRAIHRLQATATMVRRIAVVATVMVALHRRASIVLACALLEAVAV